MGKHTLHDCVFCNHPNQTDVRRFIGNITPDASTNHHDRERFMVEILATQGRMRPSVTQLVARINWEGVMALK